MANVKAAIDSVLLEEDAKLSGVVTNTSGDLGLRTKWGVSERFHSELTATGFFDSMDRTTSLAVAEGVYGAAYAAPLRISAINDQALAHAVLSLGVVSGVGTSAKVLQAAICSHQVHVDVDGHVGPATLRAANMLAPETLLFTFSELAKRHFKDIVTAKPSQMKFFRGWTNRASGWLAA